MQSLCGSAGMEDSHNPSHLEEEEAAQWGSET